MRTTIRLLLAIGLITASEQVASAYCFTSTCRDRDICPGGEPLAPSCIPTTWKRPCVSVNVQVDASSQVPFDVTDALVTEAFAAWNNAACDTGAKPNIHVENLGPAECASIEFNQYKGGNANVVIFRDEKWPHSGESTTIALTTVTYNTETGEIVGADMEVNSKNFTFTTSDTDVNTDLLSILTHEAGHFLGLAHSNDLSATMYEEYDYGIGMRLLAPDDINAICTAYPPQDPPIDPETCNPIPKYGFSSECLSQQTDRSCSVHPMIGTREESPCVLMMASLAVLASSRRIRKRRARPHS
jgi:predicted Zn-dependent protease